MLLTFKSTSAIVLLGIAAVAAGAPQQVAKYTGVQWVCGHVLFAPAYEKITPVS